MFWLTKIKDKYQKYKFSGRLNVIKNMSGDKKGLSLSIGCGDSRSRFADVNMDINPVIRPDVVGDATRMPFKSTRFGQVYFTDVIEHLPEGHDLMTLKEINRVLNKGGELILSLPNSRTIYNLLDPIDYITNHRHYKDGVIREMLNKNGFVIKEMFCGGNIMQGIKVLLDFFISYPAKRFLGLDVYIPLIEQVANMGYDKRKKDGYTIFIKAVKR